MKKPIYDIAQLTERMNARAIAQHEPPRWNRWNVRLLLEAGGVRFVQRAPGCKLQVMLSELRNAFPEFVDSLLLSEALADDHFAA